MRNYEVTFSMTDLNMYTSNAFDLKNPVKEILILFAIFKSEVIHCVKGQV